MCSSDLLEPTEQIRTEFIKKIEQFKNEPTVTEEHVLVNGRDIAALEPSLVAASIMTPMMLFALTRRVPFSIQTSALKPDASCVNLADAQACSPSLLII